MKDTAQPTAPASQQLASALRAALAEAQYVPGDKLPSERALAAEHGVARNTARAAIRLLAEQGLVDAHHGRGVFVREPRKLLRLGAQRYSSRLRDELGVSPFRAEVIKQGRTPRTECRSIVRVPAPVAVAERLGVAADAEVIRRENWYFADDEPVQSGITWIPVDIAGTSVLADSADLGPGSIYARFEELGYFLADVREEVSARMPTPDEERQLSIPGGVPVLIVTHTGFDHHRNPFEVTVFTLRADLNELDYRFPVDDFAPDNIDQDVD